jgi:murein L,D-transpeptidase YcbB/YkuD
MRRIYLVLFAALLMSIPQLVMAQGLSDQIRISLEKSAQEKPHQLTGISVFNLEAVYQFFARRNFNPIWSSEGVLTERAYEMRFEIRQAKFDGLKPGHYHLSYLDASLEEAARKKKAGERLEEVELSHLEVLLTDAFFELAGDLERGKINPALLKASWSIPRRGNKVDYGELLTASIAKDDLRSGLAELYPKTPLYPKGRQLMRELEEKSKTESLAWKPLKLDKVFKVGDSNPMLPQIRDRLAFWGYSPVEAATDPRVYDSLLFHTVVRFQEDQGMTGDGVLGRLTLAVLNESPAQLMQKISVNLERLRWIPDEFFVNEAIFVNIPSFRLVYRNSSDTLFSTKVIVGTVKHQSPVFTAPMSYLVFSPYWNIPPSIVKNETIPAIKKNPGYLDRNHMEVVNSSGNPVPRSAVNWNTRPFPYLIRQKPGPDNALGLVKFMFPNPNNVYLHDTPTKQLFDREVRTFSHGCIRMENPKIFAELLLQPMPEWTPDKILEAMNQPGEQIVHLKKKIPVVITYLTIVLNSKGKIQFRQDVYNRDPEIFALLNR